MTQVVAAAARRAGLDRVHAHRLRHEAHDLFVVAQQHAARWRTCVRQAEDLELRGNVNLEFGLVVQPRIAEVDHEIRLVFGDRIE